MNRIYSLIVLLFASFAALAGELEFSERVESSSITGASFTVYDNEYATMLTNPAWSSLFSNKRVVNKVTLGLNPEVQQTTAFSGSATVKVKRWKWSGSSFTTFTDTVVLEVNYDLTGTNAITELATYTDEGAHRLEVTVLSTTGLTLSALYLQGSITVDRDYVMSSGLSNIAYAVSDDFIDFSWDAKIGAEWYELEWMHINDYQTENGTYMSQADLPFDFRQNAARVTISATHYRIPKIFDHGYVLYRVRAVGLQGPGFNIREEGPWEPSLEADIVSHMPPGYRIAITTEYDTNMNWSHQVAYTENGKRFEGVSFADGLGRVRQSVGSNPVTEQVIVSNPYYDAHGRVTLTHLPTPVDTNVMHHFPDFNRADRSTAPSFFAYHFDSAFVSEDCAFQTLGFHEDYGTGNYYSDANPNTDGPNKLIPDAEHFPFARIEYTPDHTGRVKRSGAFGPDFQTGSGHQTEFVYSIPSQEEINRLFGSEVGYATHYRKHVTIDANHQAYVEYFDLAGRLIASGLTGGTPSNVDEIDGGHDPENTLVHVTDSTPGQTLSPAGLPVSMSIQYAAYITNEDDYAFTYALEPEQFTSDCTPELCFDCMYDLRIRITDVKCQTEIYADTFSINGGEYNALCDGDYPFAADTAIHLVPGEYTIEKVLEIDPAAIAGYWCMYLEADTCSATFAELFDSLYVQADFSACEPDTVTGAFGPCDLQYQLMLLDVSPGGQYFLDSTSAVSVLNTGNVLGTNYNWKHPATQYVDENGDPVLLTVVPDGFGGYIPAVDPLVTPIGPLPGGVYQIAPEDLRFEIDFMNAFKPTWAESLLPFHPEYCYLEFCWDNASSQSYDSLLLSVTEHDVACAMGLYDPLEMGVPPLPMHYDVWLFDSCTASLPDPFFQPWGQGAGFNSAMQDSIEHYVTIDGITLSMWEYAVLIVKCPEADESTELNACLDRFAGDRCINDQIWLTFLQLYLQEKQEFIQLAMETECDLVCEDIGDPGSTNPDCEDFENSVSRWELDTQLAHLFDLNDPQGEVETYTQELCEDLCAAYADDWMATLSNCPALDTIGLRADFIALCSAGCDPYHPTGATSLDPTGGSLVLPSGAGTIPAGSTINDILDLHIAGGLDESDLCTELLINGPGHYEAELAADYYLDTCGCNIIEDTKSQFGILEAEEDLPPGVTSVEDLLFYTTGIRVPDIDEWLCICKDNGHEQLRELRIPVPDGLTCDNCTSCEVIETLHGDLLERFDEVEAFDSTANYPVILTNFFNQELGFTLTYADYVQFIAQCGGTETAPYCELTPEILSWFDVMNLIVHRGQLVTDEADKIDLTEENIVYPGSAFQAHTGIVHYWSVRTDNALELKDDDGKTSICSQIRLFLPDGAGFDFEDIVNFVRVTATTSSCEDNTEFLVEVQYLDCGELHTAFLTGQSNCFQVQTCYCDDALTLCNKPLQESMTNNTPCYEPQLSQIYQLALEQYEAQTDALYQQFTADYNGQCAAAFGTEAFAYEGPNEAYQFTLFYYDQAGNLVKTVAPKGVDYLTDHAGIGASRDNTTGIDDQEPPVLPAQTFETEYVYNSYNQPVSTVNPDQEGATVFWYDFYGRIVASQNPVQADDGQYRYTLYDPQGRPVQVGQVVPLTPLTEALVKANDLGANFKDWVEDGTLTEVTITTYDRPLLSLGNIVAKFKRAEQTNLRLRVAAVAYYESFIVGVTDPILDYTSAIHYSYDLHGNVVESIQDVPLLQPVEQDIKSTQYTFELVSGNVKTVKYEELDRDQLTHRYTYDALNRLTEVHTSTDGGIHESREAHYRYFDYGPLARVEIGEHKVQANDFAYTVNGWLKGMNSNTLKTTRDMGLDGETGYWSFDTDIHTLVARDVTGYTIGYYQGDYTGIGLPEFEAAVGTGNDLANALRNLYNGNIAHTVTAIDGFDIQAGVYSYDQLQRLKQMQVFRDASVFPTNTWASAAETDEYASGYTYDLNGNITALNRNGITADGLDMDRFEYTLWDIGSEPSNRLNKVKDNGTDYAPYSDVKGGQSDDNYVYDKLGQLESDVQEGISKITWRRGDKKIRKIERSDMDSPEVEFVYNPLGQRVLKIERPRSGGVVSDHEDDWKYTYYAYDANGAVMATYDVVLSEEENTAAIAELNIYGAGRIGVIEPERVLYEDGPPADWEGYGEDNIFWNTLGRKKYELTNYLGNVNAVITDRKMVSGGASAYEAVVIMQADYYPFGMTMPGRSSDVEEYRYAYNGMEQDPEVKGNGNSYTTEFRQYDPRLGRWLSLDPLMKMFPWMSPYVGFDDNPIFYTDVLGLSSKDGKDGTPNGLPTNPTDGGIYTGDDGRKYIWLMDDDGTGVYTPYLEEVQVVFTSVHAPPGYSSVTSVGGKQFFIQSSKGAKYANQDIPNLDVSKGEVIEFRAYGKKFKASFDEYGDFEGYYSKGDKEYFKPHFRVGSKNYTANSIQTLAGRDDKNDFTGNFTSIVNMSDQDLEIILAYGTCVLDIWNNGTKEEVVMAESIGGSLDFKNVLYDFFGWDSQALVKFRGTVYNANEIGNLVWAVVLTYEGVFIDPAFLAEAGTSGSRHDEAHEQIAIDKGSRLGNKITSKKWTRAIEGWIPMIRERYQK